MKIFVTGSTGLLGSNLVRSLHDHGHQVSALVRSPEKARALLGSRARLVEGDMTAVSRFAPALAGCDALMHAAAYYSEHYQNGKHTDRAGLVNVKGTATLLEAAVRHGIRNIVYISSSGVLESQQERPIDEQSPYDETTRDAYFKSKIDAEKLVLRFAETHPDVRIVLLLPTVMLGPMDSAPTPTGKFIQGFLAGRVKLLLPGSMHIVDARDVVELAIRCIHKGEPCGRYLVGGRHTTIEELLGTLAELTGRPPLTKRISPRKLFLVAHVLSALGKLTGKAPPLEPNIVKRLQQDFHYDSTRAQQTLGAQFRPLRETLADTVAWFEHSTGVRGDQA